MKSIWKHLYFTVSLLLVVQISCERKWANIYDPDSGISHEWAPVNLQITQIGTKQIRLNWEHQDDRIDGFILDRRLGDNQPWEEDYRMLDKDQREIVENLNLTGVQVAYRLVAFADEANSQSITDTNTLSFPPPQMLTWNAINESTIELNWDDHQYLDVSKYLVERKSGSDDYIVIDTVSESKYSDTTLVFTEEYSFRIRASTGDMYSEATPPKTIRWQEGEYSINWEGVNANGVHKIIYNDQGNLMAAIGGWTFNIYNAYNGELIFTGSHNSGINDLVFVENNRVVSVGWDGVKLWDISTGELLASGSGFANINHVVYSPDNQKIYYSGYDTGDLVCVNSEDLSIFWDNGGDRWIQDIDLSPDGSMLVMITTSSELVVFNAINGSVLHQFFGNETAKSCRFSPDETKYALLSTSHIKIFRISDHSLLWENIGYQEFNGEIIFSNDGDKIVFSITDTMKVSNSEDGTLLWSAQLNASARITFLDVSPDNQRLVTTHRDNAIRMWDLNSGSELWSYEFTSSTNVCVFSPDNNRIAAGDYDGNLKVWIEKTWVEKAGE